MMDKRDELIVKLVDEINPRVDSHQYDLVVEALECVGYPVKVIMDYLSGDAVLGTVQPDTAQTERDKAAYAEFEAGYQAAGVQVVEVVTDSGIKQRGVWHTIDNTERLFIDVADVSALVKERDELARKLAAAEAERISTEYKYIGLQRNTIKWLFDDAYKDDSSEEEDSDYVKDNKIIEAIKGQNVTITHLKQKIANPQPAPAGNSELVAAVKQVIALAPDERPSVPYEITLSTLHPTTMWHVKQILAAALDNQ